VTRTAFALALAAGVVGALLTAALGRWQLDRAEQKLQLAATREKVQQSPAVTLTASSLPAVVGRLPLRVRAEGEFLFDRTVFLDNRQHEGRPGFWVITPLRLAEGAVVLVNRGWAARDPLDRARVPAIDRPRGVVQVEGIAQAQVPRLLDLGAAGPRSLPGVWQNLDLPAFESASGLRVAALAIEQHNELPDALLRAWPAIESGVERHHGYAVQWFALSALLSGLTMTFGARAWLRRASLSKEVT
jgi:surfeit locus 1 family protein